MKRWFADMTGWREAVMPAFDGGSIANLPASIVMALHGESDTAWAGMAPPLRPEILPSNLFAGSRVVILAIIDGLDALALDRWRETGKAGIFDQADHRATITSVFPSTTAAALTTLQTGVVPGRHGMAGYTLYLHEIDQVLNMITWKPADGERELRGHGPSTTGFLPVPTIFERLARYARGVDTVVVSNALFSDSALTNLHSRGVRYRGYGSLTEFAYRIRREVERPGRRFVSAYWDKLDDLSHSYRPDSDVADLEFALIEHALRAGVVEPLAALGEPATLIITADHGHVPLPQEKRIPLDDYGIRLDGLAHRPTGEPRTTGLTLLDESQRDRLRAGLGERGAVLAVDDAIEHGLYGPPPHHPDLKRRIGNTIVLGRGETAFRYADFNSGVIGGHGSLTAEEMLVPLLVWRFGDGPGQAIMRSITRAKSSRAK